MIIILCLDDRNGMMFNNRRQSRDKAVVENIIKITNGKRLFMNEYSAEIFPMESKNIFIDNNFLSKANDDDFCFIENIDLNKTCLKIDKIIVYRWNRIYPSDLKFEIILNQWTRVVEAEFVGNSHNKITREVYTK